MNLTKLFNKNYLLQNIKKSRGLFALFFVLVPLFTVLFTTLVLNTEDTLYVAEGMDIAFVNLIGMYVIPLVISMGLFGYIYKKISVDFVNSMPMNRKTIFVTNTVGGILLITVIQIITAMALWLCSIFCNNLMIFPELIWDISILMWVSYVFVFVATNVAMSISGTFLTQIAITMLIVFLVPFCTDGFHDFTFEKEYHFISGANEFVTDVPTNINSFSMPYRMFRFAVNGAEENFYSNELMIRMLVLSVIYFGIGMFLFERRKMENTEESFATVKAHLFIKALTMVPMIIVLNLIDGEIEFNIFAVALMVVYYFVFDFIVKRKVKLPISIGACIATLLILQGLWMGGRKIVDSLPEKNLDRKDIIAVAIGDYDSYRTGYSSRRWVSLENSYLENEEIINLIFNSAYEADKEMEGLSNGKPFESKSYVHVTFKTKNGKEIDTRLTLLSKDFEKVLSILENDEQYITAFKKSLEGERVISIQNSVLDVDKADVLSKELDNQLNSMTLEEIFSMSSEINARVDKYYYKDHAVIQKRFPIDLTPMIFKISAESMNQFMAKMVDESIKNEDGYRSFYIENISKNLEYNGHYLSSDMLRESVDKFILNHSQDSFDPEKPYYVIGGNTEKYRYSLHFYTNEVEEINNIVKSDKELEEVELYDIMKDEEESMMYENSNIVLNTVVEDTNMMTNSISEQNGIENEMN